MPSIVNQSALDAAFARRYPLDVEGNRLMRELGPKLCRDFLIKGLGDINSESRLCSQDNNSFWQQFSEVVLADQMEKVSLSLSRQSAGPDFLIEHQQKRIWVEVICPTPVGVPMDWLNPPNCQAYSLPHEALLLRWTSAIKEKAEKLIGKPGIPQSGYLHKGYVGEDDAYVIAINARLLRAGWPQIEGISQWPFAVEATFSVGPYALTLDKNSLDVVDRGHQHRPIIPKPNGATVPADTFHDPRFAPISAVWATDFDECLVIGKPQPMVVVHNPAARNPLERNILPAFNEYVALKGVTDYTLERCEGRLTT